MYWRMREARPGWVAVAPVRSITPRDRRVSLDEEELEEEAEGHEEADKGPSRSTGNTSPTPSAALESRPQESYTCKPIEEMI